MQVQIRWFYPLVMGFAVLAGLPSLVTWQSRGRGRGWVISDNAPHFGNLPMAIYFFKGAVV